MSFLEQTPHKGLKNYDTLYEHRNHNRSLLDKD